MMVDFTRIIAGIQVPNTHIINASIALAHQNLPTFAYNHVMRAWLNGQAIVNKLPAANLSTFDQEAFGVGAILHDLGWWVQSSPSHVYSCNLTSCRNKEIMTIDTRFEVDGADQARQFLQQNGGGAWDKHRQQLVWDSIAIHSTASIALYKELEVALVAAGTATDVLGPDIAKVSFGDLITVTQTEYDHITKEFPFKRQKALFIDVAIHLCQFKPETTYDNVIGDFGDKYLQNYTRVGHRLVDVMETVMPE